MGKKLHETVGNLKTWFHKFIIKWSSLSFNTTMLDCTKTQKQMQRCDRLISTPLIRNHIAPTWGHHIFISFPNWSNIFKDINTCLAMKSRQQLSYGSIIRVYNSIVKDLWTYINVVESVYNTKDTTCRNTWEEVLPWEMSQMITAMWLWTNQHTKNARKNCTVDGGLLTLGKIWKHPMPNMQTYTDLTNG